MAGSLLLSLLLGMSPAPFFECASAIQRVSTSVGWHGEKPLQEVEIHLLQSEVHHGQLWMEVARLIRTRSRLGFFTENISREIHRVDAENPRFKNLPTPLGKNWLWSLVQPHLQLIRKEYRRRKFPEALHQKLDKNSFKYLNEAKWTTIYDQDSGLPIGGSRVIEIPYLVENGQITPRGSLISARYGKEFEGFRMHDEDVASIFSPPPKFLPVEDYLDFEVPLFTILKLPDDGGPQEEIGIKSEIGALAVEHSLHYEKRLRVLAEVWIHLHANSRDHQSELLNFSGQSSYAYADTPDGLELYLPIGLRVLKKSRSGRDVGSQPTIRDNTPWLPLIYSPAMMDLQNRRFIEGRRARFNSHSLRDRRAELIRDRASSYLDPLPELIATYRGSSNLSKFEALRAIENRLHLLAIQRIAIAERPGTLMAAEASEFATRLEEEAREIEDFLLEDVRSVEGNDAELMATQLGHMAATASYRSSLSKETLFMHLLLPLMAKGQNYSAVAATRSYFDIDEVREFFRPKPPLDHELRTQEIESRLFGRGYTADDRRSFTNFFYSIWNVINEEYSDGFYQVYIASKIYELCRGNLDDLFDLSSWASFQESYITPMPEPWYTSPISEPLTHSDPKACP
jgi:hypothetical protein